MARVCLNKPMEGVEGGIDDDIEAVEGGSGETAPPSREVVECEEGIIEKDDVIGEDASKERWWCTKQDSVPKVEDDASGAKVQCKLLVDGEGYGGNDLLVHGVGHGEHVMANGRLL